MSQYSSAENAVLDENGIPLYGLDLELYLKNVRSFELFLAIIIIIIIIIIIKFNTQTLTRI